MDVDASVMVKVHIGARVVTFMDETSFIRAIHRQIKLTIQVEGGMVGQKSRRNSGFLPHLAADGVGGDMVIRKNAKPTEPKQ